MPAPSDTYFRRLMSQMMGITDADWETIYHSAPPHRDTLQSMIETSLNDVYDWLLSQDDVRRLFVSRIHAKQKQLHQYYGQFPNGLPNQQLLLQPVTQHTLTQDHPIMKSTRQMVISLMMTTVTGGAFAPRVSLTGVRHAGTTHAPVWKKLTHGVPLWQMMGLYGRLLIDLLPKIRQHATQYGIDPDLYQKVFIGATFLNLAIIWHTYEDTGAMI
jgi:hypothetical protein